MLASAACFVQPLREGRFRAGLRQVRHRKASSFEEQSSTSKYTTSFDQHLSYLFLSISATQNGTWQASRASIAVAAFTWLLVKSQNHMTEATMRHRNAALPSTLMKWREFMIQQRDARPGMTRAGVERYTGHSLLDSDTLFPLCRRLCSSSASNPFSC